MEDSPLSNSTQEDFRRDESTPQDSRHLSPTKSDTSVPDGPTRKDTSNGKQITRRPHRKSRYGCKNCKALRIKCDERKPECTNCVKRSNRCDYLLSITPASSVPERSRLSINSSGNATTLNVPDLELMYTWTTSTCSSLSMWNSGSIFWKSDAAEIGLAHSHVLHLIFALTSLHLAYCRPARRVEYLAQSDRHYALGVSTVTSELSKLNPDNCDPVYMSVQLICFVCLARGPQPSDYLAFGKSGRSEWLIMFRGIRTTLETVGSEHFQKTHSGRTRAGAKGGRPLPDLNTPEGFTFQLEELRKHVGILTTAETEREDDVHAVDVLIECYTNRYSGKDGEYHIVFAWLYRMPEGFLERMQRQEPAPLIIYAHWAVLLMELERFWYMKGWTHHVMAGIWDILADEHRIWIRWPMGQVGWIPS